MAVKTIGVLCMSVEDFNDFEQSNSTFFCVRLHTTNDLIDMDFDFFIRLGGWQNLSKGLLQVVEIQEKLKGDGATKIEKMRMYIRMTVDRITKDRYHVRNP